MFFMYKKQDFHIHACIFCMLNYLPAPVSETDAKPVIVANFKCEILLTPRGYRVIGSYET